MDNKFVIFTETYNIQVVKALGGDIVAATLYNKILNMHKHGTPRKDGFNWMTDQQIADQMGVSRHTIVNAFKKLVDAGMVECAKKMVIGHSVPVRHFKPVKTHELFKICTTWSSKIEQSVNMNKLINNNNNNKLKHFLRKPATPVSTQTEPPSADASGANAPEGVSPLSNLYGATTEVIRTVSPGSSQHREGWGVVKNTTSDPFSAPVKNEVDLAEKMKKKQAENAKVAILAQRLFDEFNGETRHKPSAAVRQAVRAKLLNENFSERELLLAVKRGKKLDWYASRPVEVAIKEAGKLLNDKFYKKEMDKQTYDSIQSHLM